MPRLTLPVELPHSAHLAPCCQPLLLSPKPGMGQQRRTAHPLCLPQLLPLGCRTRSPPSSQMLGVPPAQPWRRCFQSLPTWQGWQGEQWRRSSRGPLCACPCVLRLSWHAWLVLMLWMLLLDQAPAVPPVIAPAGAAGSGGMFCTPACSSVCSSSTSCLLCWLPGKVFLAGAFGWGCVALS